MRRLVTLLILFTLAASAAFPQDTHDWETAIVRLHAGDRVRLSLTTGKIDTTFLNASAQDLSVKSGTIKKEDVRQIERVVTQGHGSRLKHALLGSIIGAGGGVGVGAVMRHIESKNGSFALSQALALSIFAVTGAMVGTFAGALLPAGHTKRETIYSAP